MGKKDKFGFWNMCGDDIITNGENGTKSAFKLMATVSQELNDNVCNTSGQEQVAFKIELSTSFIASILRISAEQAIRMKKANKTEFQTLLNERVPLFGQIAKKNLKIKIGMRSGEEGRAFVLGVEE